ncbi:MAG: hypothetical protein HRT88_05265 [Lentisphaeraceae bacterium]|nr:hypothetical protein [Lentisphaeraceae bacterium]
MEELEEPKEKKVPEEMTCPEWMMTMGDCMSLLLTFFVLLLTFSTTSESRLMDVIGVMKGAFSFIESQTIMNKEQTAYNTDPYEEEDALTIRNIEGHSDMHLGPLDIQHRVKDLKETLNSIGFKHALELNKLDQGVAIEIAVDDLFGPDSVKLTYKGKKLIAGIADIADNTLQEIRVVNFIKPEAMGKFMSASENAAKHRNFVIAKFLTEKYAIKESRLGVGVTVDRGGGAFSESINTIKIIFVESLNVKEVGIAEMIRE